MRAGQQREIAAQPARQANPRTGGIVGRILGIPHAPGHSAIRSNEICPAFCKTTSHSPSPPRSQNIVLELFGWPFSTIQKKLIIRLTAMRFGLICARNIGKTDLLLMKKNNQFALAALLAGLTCFASSPAQALTEKEIS